MEGLLHQKNEFNLQYLVQVLQCEKNDCAWI